MSTDDNTGPRMSAADMTTLVRLVQEYGADELAALARGVGAALAAGEEWTGAEWRMRATTDDAGRGRPGRPARDRRRLVTLWRLAVAERRAAGRPVTRVGIAADVAKAARAGDPLTCSLLGIVPSAAPPSAVALRAVFRGPSFPT